MAGAPALPGRAAQLHPLSVDGVELRELGPRVLSVLVRRGADFATAEDAVQEALIRALSAWGEALPADRTGWLITVAWRAFLDMTRSNAARRDRERRFDTEPLARAIPSADDTLRLYFLCAHPDLTSSSAVALTLRAVGGLTTRQIAEAYLVPEPTMAQRISRAKRTVSRAGVDRPGDVRTVMRVLYLVFNEGYSGDVDLAAEAIRLTRQLAVLVDDPEVHGLLALMLLHHARRRSRTRPDGSIVPLADQDRSQWDTGLIAEGNRHRARCARARSARRIPGASGDRRAPCRRAACHRDRLGPDRGVVRRATPVRRHSDRPAQPCGRSRRGRRRARRTGGTGRGRRRSPAARSGSRVLPRKERRSRARGPPLCQRSSQRTQPRRTRPSDAPSSATQPAPATPQMTSRGCVERRTSAAAGARRAVVALACHSEVAGTHRKTLRVGK